MNIKKEKLMIEFTFKSEEEQNFWEEKLVNLAKYYDEERQCDMADNGYINKNIAHHKMELEKLEKLKYRYKIGEDGFNKLINLGNLK